MKIIIKHKRKLLLLCTILFFLVSGGIFYKLNGIREKVFIKNGTISQGHDSLADKIQRKVALNILLLGYGGGDHDGAYLTDSMIVVHLDPTAQTTTLISIPRDIWVQIPTNGNKGSFWKINAAYTIGSDDTDYPKKQAQFTGPAGGGNLTKEVVEQVTGLSIDRFIALDFNGFKKSIDTLGGIDVKVEKTFDDYEYPIDGKENDLCGHAKDDLPDLVKVATISAVQAFPCRYRHLHFDAGLTHMDGESALSFVRSRHSLQDGTDFGRSTRQRNLLVAVENQVFNVSFIPKIIPFATSLQDDVRTDLKPQEIAGLLNLAGIVGKYKVSNIALSDQNVLVNDTSDDGQYILTSKEGLNKWDLVRSWIQSSLNNTRILASPVIQVQNGTTVPGLATLAYNRLQDKDFNLLPPSSADQLVDKTLITVFTREIDTNILGELKKEFNVQNIVTQPSMDQPYDILIVLGNDYNLTQGKKLIN